MTPTDATTGSATADVTPSLWREEIINAFQARLTRDVLGYELLNLTLDREYLRYFDRILTELSRAESRLPHPRTTNRTLLRSAAVEVVMGAFVAPCKTATRVAGDPGDLAEALTGDLGNFLADGFERRMDPFHRGRLENRDLLLLPGSARRLGDEIRRLMASHFPVEEHDFYLGEALGNLRSAFLEACIVTWMIMHELVADEAIPARNAFAPLDAQGSAPRRRRRLRRA